MSATNKTTYYDLPIFIGTDVPSWLGDWNGAMNAIDTAIQGVDSKAQSASTTANSASSGVSQANESISALSAEVETIKKAVQNYDAILDFHPVATAMAVNNMSYCNHYMVQNTNKTLNRIYVSGRFLTTIANATQYTYTDTNKTGVFWELFTAEDNVFNLSQGSLPNYQICLSCGMAALIKNIDPAVNTPNVMGRTFTAWFDGATTHFGIVSAAETKVSDIQGAWVLIPSCSVFLAGSVYNPPLEGETA